MCKAYLALGGAPASKATGQAAQAKNWLKGLQKKFRASMIFKPFFFLSRTLSESETIIIAGRCRAIST